MFDEITRNDVVLLDKCSRQSGVKSNMRMSFLFIVPIKFMLG